MKTKRLKTFAALAVALHDDHNGEVLLNEGSEVQEARIVSKLKRFTQGTPLTRAKDLEQDLGRGVVDVHFCHGDTRYMLLSEIATAVDWPIQTAAKWAEMEHEFALRDQRDADEERGDGLLGWDHMRDYVDLGVEGVIDDPEAKPDADGKRWSHTGDWLISHHRLQYLLMLVDLHHEQKPATMLRRIGGR
jgi:hypothetical protein